MIFGLEVLAINRRMMRLFCIVLASVLLLLCLVACKSGEDGDATDMGDEMTLELNPEGEEPFSLRVGSYNIAIAQRVGFDVAPLAEDVLSKSLDVVGFQEVDQGAERSAGIDTMKRLSEETGYAYYQFFKAISVGKGSYGLGILSRYPIVKSEWIPLESGGGEQRILAHATIDVDGTWIDFFVTHLTFGANDIRNAQFQTVADLVSRYENFVLVGDFNTRSFDDYPQFDGAGMVNNREFSLPTFSKYDLTLDNIIYSASSWSFSKPETLDNGHSDHYMLYATGTYIPRAVRGGSAEK